MNIYLVRHGETDWNKEGRLQGQRDIPMNQYGILQMERIGAYMANGGYGIDKIISSPLQRARMGAAIIASRIGYGENEIIVEPLLIERSFGDAEGMVWTAEVCLDDGKFKEESVSELCKRAAEGIKKYAVEENGNILIVSHGAILKAVIVELTHGKITYYDNSVSIAQGGISYIKYEGEQYAIKWIQV